MFLYKLQFNLNYYKGQNTSLDEIGYNIMIKNFVEPCEFELKEKSEKIINI